MVPVADRRREPGTSLQRRRDESTEARCSSSRCRNDGTQGSRHRRIVSPNPPRSDQGAGVEERDGSVPEGGRHPVTPFGRRARMDPIPGLPRRAPVTTGEGPATCDRREEAAAALLAAMAGCSSGGEASRPRAGARTGTRGRLDIFTALATRLGCSRGTAQVLPGDVLAQRQIVRLRDLAQHHRWSRPCCLVSEGDMSPCRSRCRPVRSSGERTADPG